MSDSDDDSHEEEVKENEEQKTKDKFLNRLKNSVKNLNWSEVKEKATGTQGLVWGTVTFGTIFLVVIIVQSCTPQKGNILYAMCGEFLKLQIPYPHTIQYKRLAFYPAGVRIYYTHIDAFGQYQLEHTECSFYQDPEKGVQFDEIYFNYVKDVTSKERSSGKGRLYKVREDVIEKFNNSMSPAAMLTSEPDLVIPEGVEFE